MTRKRIARTLPILGAGAVVAFCFAMLVAPWCIAPPRQAAAAPPPAGRPRNVLLISWDGVDRTVLKELLEANRLPHLAAIIREGSLQDIEVVGHQTETKPSHAEMLTGLGARTTGVVTNKDYQPIPEGYTIFERVQKQLGKDRIRTIMVTSKIGNLGGRGPGEIPDDGSSGAKKGEPYFLTKKHLDAFDAHDRDAAETAEVALNALEQFKAPRFLAFFHFRDPDSAGHARSSASEEYRQGAVACDEALASIVEWLKKEKLYDQTLIYVTADHGFDRNATTHNNAPHIWLATNNRAVTKGGTQADVPATILERFGVNLSTLKPPLIGKPLTAPAAKAAPTTRISGEPRDSGLYQFPRQPYRVPGFPSYSFAKDATWNTDPSESPT